MPRVKIYLEPNETIEEAKELISKAFAESDIHEHIHGDHRPFQDPVLQGIHKELNSEFSTMFNQMFQEIETVVKNPHLTDLL